VAREDWLPYSQELTTGTIPNQINPVHTTPFYFSNIDFNIIFLPTSKSLYMDKKEN
jgi:hypothetical protein